MALTYLGTGAAAQRGVEVAEAGVSIMSWSVEYFSEVSEYRQSNLGETDGAAISTLASRNITMEAEITGTTGRMLDTFVAAITTLTNDVAEFGGATGGIYLKRVTINQSRGDWRKGTWNYESRPLLA